MSVRNVGRHLFRYLPGERYAFAASEWVLNRVAARSLWPAGFHVVSVAPDGVDPFDIWLPVHGPSHRAQLRGTYETAVTDLLSRLVDADSVVWEVGGGFGFHSLAWAQVAQRVVTFEANEFNVGKIRDSVEQNGFGNVEVVAGTVGEDVSLDDYAPPDVIVLDVEGAELRIVERSPSTLAAGPDWVVEVHEDSLFDDGEGVDPERLYTVFEDAGYRCERISERSPANYHVCFTRRD